ncbi:helix-hairpin-helix domain-containing protein [Methanobrevibacter curvatus]|uniref:Helix-hairpin-helix motif protein n=1 Tax=Methanobrevibacter curvatus TaxID=49547 RepID=A0A165Z7D2_9EURY|nr:helix-hairpin-helix domain-containing protein [Methanobrevibacter curvatus]KZX10346.1 helix-hairpin-helix motif protein [Methanobrevibacter curvatus]
MNTLKKMQVLCDYAQYDLCDYVAPTKESSPNLPGIYQATSNGCKIPLFKVLMTNKCMNNCKYCVNQSKRNFTRLELKPEEIANTFLNYYNNDYVNGLFLSSGIVKSVDETMENLIETIRLLRKNYGYQDYIHLKIIPGASKDSIKRAMSLADRVSINIESGTESGLNEISPNKNLQKDIIRRFKWINNLSKRNRNLAPAGSTTQYIIGANNESDEEVLSSVNELYKKINLKRSYYSPFESVAGTEFENHENCDNKRSNRLYQADALISQYNFKLNELIFNKEGILIEEDPKYASALEMDIFPVDINSASYKELIRVPGIGLISAKKILKIRKKQKFKNIEQLKKIGVVTSRAEKFIKIDGSYQSSLNF